MSLCEYKYRNMSYGGLLGAPATGVQARKYGGKELDRENALDWLDSQARIYDPLTGRTPTMDQDISIESIERHKIDTVIKILKQ